MDEPDRKEHAKYSSEPSIGEIETLQEPREDFTEGTRGDAWEPPDSPALADDYSLQQPEAATWSDPKPIPESLPPVAPFDYAMLPNALAPFISDVAERMQCPPDFPAVAMMTSYASVVGRQVGMCPKREDDWLVVPNLWGALIGRPGIMKTPAAREAIKFLQRLEIEANDTYAEAMQNYENKLAIAKVRKAQKEVLIKEAIKKGKDPLAAAQASDDIEELEEPTRRRHIVNDSTVEALGHILNQNPTGVMVFRDEIAGWLANLDRDGQEAARAFYLESWDGLGRFAYDRIGRGHLEIKSVTVSIMGGIQPGRLSEYLRSAVRGGVGDDGMMQRFQLAVYPDVTREWRNVDRWPDTIEKQRVWSVFKSAANVDTIGLGAERDDRDIPFLRFTEESQSLFDDWRGNLERKVRSGEEHPAIESHLAKYRSLVPRLALLIHLAEGGTGRIAWDATEKALSWAGYLESHARRIYAIVTRSAPLAAKALVERIRKGDVKDRFTQRSIYRNEWAGLDRSSTDAAVDLLVELGWLKEVEGTTGGKPRVSYRINPRIPTKV